MLSFIYANKVFIRSPYTGLLSYNLLSLTSGVACCFIINMCHFDKIYSSIEWIIQNSLYKVVLFYYLDSLYLNKWRMGERCHFNISDISYFLISFIRKWVLYAQLLIGMENSVSFWNPGMSIFPVGLVD